MMFDEERRGSEVGNRKLYVVDQTDPRFHQTRKGERRGSEGQRPSTCLRVYTS